MAVVTKDTKPVFLSGDIYFDVQYSEEVNNDPENDLEQFRYDSVSKIGRASIIPNGDNERLKFDIAPNPGFCESYFAGFLYPNGSVLGKIKYTKDTQFQDDAIQGNYQWVSGTELVIKGNIDFSNGRKEAFCVALEVCEKA